MLSHGDASVERQFSTNNIINRINIIQSIMARKYIFDRMTNETKSVNIEMNKDLDKAARDEHRN